MLAMFQTVEFLLIFQSLQFSDGELYLDYRSDGVHPGTTGYYFHVGGSTRGRQVPFPFLHVSKLSCSGSLYLPLLVALPDAIYVVINDKNNGPI